MEFLKRIKNLTNKQIGLLMVLFALTIPFVILPAGRYGTDDVEFRGYALPAMIWGIGPGSSGLMFISLEVLTLFFGSPLLLFAYYVQRYCSGRSSWKAPVFVGLLHTIFLVILFSPRMLGWYEYDTMVYAGPLPITFILGLVLMRLVGAPEIDRPFDEQEGHSNWWNRIASN
ncbi:MAG: hypothetical protein ACXAB0_15670 [Candidatus Thorarchaeota archaeon]|jgi:hypothetical protein